ncbi:hypothetical protein PMAYCL1PPCAC_02440, partial [Pristionchus mayeri]
QMVDFVRSSTTFKEKIELPACWRSVPPSLVFDKLEVRHHTGFFWSRRREKECALTDSGRLFIYSSFDRGLSISLPELNSLCYSISGKEVVGREEQALSCEVEMRRGKEKLMLKIRGKEKVTRWREAIGKAAFELSPSGEMKRAAGTKYSWLWKAVPLSAKSAESSEATATPSTLVDNSPRTVTDQSPREQIKEADTNSNISPGVAPPPSLSVSIGGSFYQSFSRQYSIDNDENTVSSPLFSSRKMSKATVLSK